MCVHKELLMWKPDKRGSRRRTERWSRASERAERARETARETARERETERESESESGRSGREERESGRERLQRAHIAQRLLASCVFFFVLVIVQCDGAKYIWMGVGAGADEADGSAAIGYSYTYSAPTNTALERQPLNARHASVEWCWFLHSPVRTCPAYVGCVAEALEQS